MTGSARHVGIKLILRGGHDAGLLLIQSSPQKCPVHTTRLMSGNTLLIPSIANERQKTSAAIDVTLN